MLRPDSTAARCGVGGRGIASGGSVGIVARRALFPVWRTDSGAGPVQGFYQDPDTGEQVHDESYRFIVAVSEDKIPELRRLLQAACVMFAQKCIYLSRAGVVEFIKVEDSDAN